MACNVCRSLDFNTIVRHKPVSHHKTFEALLCSAKSGCSFCERIQHNLEDACKRVDLSPQSNSDWQIFCELHPAQWRSETGHWGFASIRFFGCVVTNGDVSDRDNRSSPAYGEEFGVYACQGTSIADSGVVTGRDISQYPDSDECYALAEKWLSECLQTHSDSCPQSTNVRLPTRVIDVGLVDDTDVPRLILTNRAVGVWVALSHCWGTVTRYVTTSDTIKSRQENIPLKDLPATFRDAILVTRRLGYRYLWIDSLCIIQDSHADWLVESSWMQEYYKNSILTITADMASGDHEGFLTKRPKVGSPVIPVILEGQQRVYIRDMVECPVFRYGTTPVTKRAWTLQEDILAPRTLHYTSGQLVWECQAHQYCESESTRQRIRSSDFENGLKRYFLKPEYGRKRFPQFSEYLDPTTVWYSIVNDYRTRRMSFTSDIFAAIGGVAREIQQQTGYTYLAGIWVEDISRGLLWKTWGGGDIPLDYRAPSWSWASLDLQPGAQVQWQPTYAFPSTSRREAVEKIEDRVALLDYSFNLANDNDIFGPLKSGSLKLRGSILSTEHWRGETNPHSNVYWDHEKSHMLRRHWDKNHTPDGVDQIICTFDQFSRNDEPVEHFYCFRVSTWDFNGNGSLISFGLILRPVEKAGEKIYKRAGVVEIPHVGDLADVGWEVKDVIII